VGTAVARILLFPKVVVPDNPKEAAMINKDEAAGKLKQGKGAMKEKAGELTNDRGLETEGAVDQAAGHVQEKTGTVERKTEEAVDELTKDRNR
jgi:uncharacterized protein YjbJ (UPF0337 family)